MTFSLNNKGKPAPRWFKRVKKMVLTLTVAANTMVPAWGLQNDLLVTRIQLWCTIGIGALLEALEIMLADTEE